jgi:endothelin-converting enzyme
MNRITMMVVVGIALILNLAACGSSSENIPEKALLSGIEKESFDPAVRYSDNFYYSINGTWIRKTEIPADKPYYGSFTKLDDEAQIAIRSIIEAVAANKEKTAGSDEQKLGDFYNSYMNETSIEALGTAPIAADIARIADIKDKNELAAAFGEFQNMGVSIPVGWRVTNDAKNSTQYALYVYQSGLGLPDRDYYLSNDNEFKSIRSAYSAYLKDILTLAGVADAENAANRILALETRLAEKQWSQVENRDEDKKYNKFAKTDLIAILGDFPWDSYAKAAKLDKAGAIIVEQPSYIEAFGTIYRETDLQTWKEYLAASFISGYAEYLSKAFVNRSFDFYGKILSGTTEQQPRWKNAVDASNTVLGEAVGKLYVAQYFKPEARKKMETLVQNLVTSFHASIDTLDWMTPETKKAAHAKLDKLASKIGYPDKWKDYSQLAIKADDLVGNYKSYYNYSNAYELDKVGKPIDRSEWSMTPQTVNAYYDPGSNEIAFPAAILQPPFFNIDADDAVNYGGIGAAIGHELSHAFDDQGAKFDGDGNLRNWWTDADKAEFDKRGKQLVEQFNRYSPISGMYVNGELTLGENIGDLSGLTIALKAYKLSLAGKEAPVMDGFTGEQRFFISWAQIWRANFRDEFMRQLLLSDPHSPNEYRVNGIVPNIPDFYTAFGVKEGDGMYIAPEKRVKLW